MRHRIVLAAAALLFAGYGCAPAAPAPAPVPEPQAVDGVVPFGVPHTFLLKQSAVFEGGFDLTLWEINDSRCPADVVCIWQGELSATFLPSASIDDQFTLGTETRRTVESRGRMITLVAVTETTATITVTPVEAR